MVTVSLQIVTGLLLALFAALTIAVARQVAPRGGVHAASWEAAAIIFAIFALNRTAQVLWAAWAFRSGPGSSVYETYLRAAPIANHSRTFLMFALYLALIVLALRPKYSASERGLLWAAVVVALFAGGMLGYYEGTLVEAVHYTRTAVIDTAGFAVLAAILFLSMVRDTVDRYLWATLALFGFTSIFSVLFLTTMAWIGVSSAWTPPNWAIQGSTAVLALGLLILAQRRLRLARRGIEVRGLIPRADTSQHLSLG